MEITRREFVVTQLETVVNYYTVNAETKEEAIRMVEDSEVELDHVQGVEYFDPVINEILEYTECPNKGEGWSSIPLEVVEGMIEDRPEMFDGIIPLCKDGKSWHYNGLCFGEKMTKEDLCLHCSNSERKGYRLLSNEEKKYLNRAYGKKLNVQE